MERYEALTLDEERALYGLNGAEVVRCTFEGPADGESALKECRDVHKTDRFANSYYDNNGKRYDYCPYGPDAMEDYALDFIVGKGPSARSMRLKIQPFTLIGATTRAGMLTNPLRDRFGVICKLELYSIEELQTIVLRSAKILGADIDKVSAGLIASRCLSAPIAESFSYTRNIR